MFVVEVVKQQFSSRSSQNYRTYSEIAHLPFSVHLKSIIVNRKSLTLESALQEEIEKIITVLVLLSVSFEQLQHSTIVRRIELGIGRERNTFS